MKFRISYSIEGACGGCGSKIIAAESRGEAIEHFELWADGSDSDIELLNVAEIAE